MAIATANVTLTGDPKDAIAAIKSTESAMTGLQRNAAKTGETVSTAIPTSGLDAGARSMLSANAASSMLAQGMGVTSVQGRLLATSLQMASISGKGFTATVYGMTASVKGFLTAIGPVGWALIGITAAIQGIQWALDRKRTALRETEEAMRSYIATAERWKRSLQNLDGIGLEGIDKILYDIRVNTRQQLDTLHTAWVEHIKNMEAADFTEREIWFARKDYMHARWRIEQEGRRREKAAEEAHIEEMADIERRRLEDEQATLDAGRDQANQERRNRLLFVANSELERAELQLEFQTRELLRQAKGAAEIEAIREAHQTKLLALREEHAERLKNIDIKEKADEIKRESELAQRKLAARRDAINEEIMLLRERAEDLQAEPTFQAMFVGLSDLHKRIQASAASKPPSEDIAKINMDIRALTRENNRVQIDIRRGQQEMVGKLEALVGGVGNLGGGVGIIGD